MPCACGACMRRGNRERGSRLAAWYSPHEAGKAAEDLAEESGALLRFKMAFPFLLPLSNRETTEMVKERDAKTGVTGPARVDQAVYELFVFSLAIRSVVVLVMYYLLPVTSSTRQALLGIDFLLSVIFLYDSFRSLFRAPDKLAYMKWGWIDFLGSIPLLVPLHVLRVARLVRAWRVVRARSPKEIMEDFATDRPLGFTLGAICFAVVALAVTSLVVLELESRAPGGNIATGKDALWWAFVTVATVGYGDLYPVTGEGRTVAILLMLVGVGLFGVLTSLLASKFVAATRSEQEDELTALRDEVSLARDDLAHVKAELAVMKDLLRERDGPSREQPGRDSEPHEGE